MGTLDYVAPEQIRGDPVDGRADQYALACLLFECLTGTLPFRRDSEMATIFAHLEEPPPAASDHRPGLPPELDAVLARAMAKDPADRYESCARARGGRARGDRARRLAPAPPDAAVAAGGSLAAVLAAALTIVLVTAARRARQPGPRGRGSRSTRTAAVTAAPTRSAEDPRPWPSARHVWVVRPGLQPLADRAPERFGEARPLRAGRPGISPTTRAGSTCPRRDPGTTTAASSRSTPFQAPSGRVEGYSCSTAAGAREGLWTTDCPQNVVRLADDSGELAVAPRLSFRRSLTTATYLLCQCDLAIGDGSVWVPGDAADSRVWRIDAKRGRLLDTIELPFAIGRGIAAGGGALWVAGLLDDIVARVDARTGRVTDRIPVGRMPMSLALGDDGLWVANQLDRSVSLVDVRRRRVVDTIPVGGAPVELAVGAGGVWAAVDG